MTESRHLATAANMVIRPFSRIVLSAIVRKPSPFAVATVDIFFQIVLSGEVLVDIQDGRGRNRIYLQFLGFGLMARAFLSDALVGRQQPRIRILAA